MNLQPITPNVIELNTGDVDRINGQDLRNFSKGTASSIASIADMLNNSILKIFNTLPDSFNPETSVLDGRHLVVDQNATADKDAGIFYFDDVKNPQNSHPLSIYEALLSILQILANIETGAKGIPVGSESEKLQLLPNETKALGLWSYSDKIFQPVLFEKIGTDIKSSDVSVYLAADGYVYVKNTSTVATKQIYGYILHPVLSI